MQHQNSLTAQMYRPDIDGLRAVAVLSVLFYHLNPSFLPGGFLGVDVFFIISGYLITGIIVRESHRGSFSFANFYSRRIKRIFPAFFVVLLLTTLLAMLLLPPETYSNFMRSARYASAQLANIYFNKKVGYFDEGFSSQPLLHTWSLGVEEQFYLFWPLLIYIFFRILSSTSSSGGRTVASINSPSHRRINTRLALLFLLLFLLSYLVCYAVIPADYNQAFYMFYSRAFEFCVGGIVAVKVLPEIRTKSVSQIAGILGFALVGYSLMFVHEEFHGRSFLYAGVLIPCLGSALILHNRPNSGVVNWALASRVPSFIGKISYSLYLYHWPVIIFWKVYHTTDELDVTACLAIFSLSLILSVLSYWLVEQPVRKSTLSGRPVLLSALAIIVVCALSFKSLEKFETADWRIHQYEKQVSQVPLWHAPECRSREENGIVTLKCQKGSSADTPYIALVGDSHALHYLRSATSWAHKTGYNVKYLGTAGCPMLLGDIKLRQSIVDEKLEEECRHALPLFEKEVVNDPLVEIVFMAQRFELLFDGKGYMKTSRVITFADDEGDMVKDHTGYYRDRLSQTTKRLKELGKEVVFLKQVPLFNGIDSCNWEPRLKKILSQQRVCEFDDDFIRKWQNPSAEFVDDFANEHGVKVFDPFPALNSPLQDGINIYQDKDHINNFGFLYLVPFFSKGMDVLLGRE